MSRIRPTETTAAALLAAGLVLLLTAGVASAQTVTLSEIRIDQPSTDNDEFFELTGAPGASLDGLTYLVIGDGAGGSGVIEAVVDLTGQVLDANGFFVAAESTFTQGTADLVANLNFENSDNVTHLVVSGFTGANADDLDTDDDGTLDVVPFAGLEDCLALIESTTSGEFTYCATGIGPDGTFVPGHVSACPGGFAIGSFATGVDDTPGAANQCPAPPVPVLVINEIDYDQPSTDTGEFIEITNTGTGAADLSAYQLELINGAGGGAAVYNTIVLPAVSLAPGAYFVVCGNAANVDNCDLDASPDSNLIQNGAPDAVALTTGGMIVDTVSYEGDVPGFTEGSGSGLTDSGSTGNDDLGISRFADGLDTDMNNVDFVFSCITPGEANTDTAIDCGVVAEPTLVINEIDYDQPGSDTAEFIEIKNVGPAAVNLAGFTVSLVNGNGGSVYNTIALPAVSLGAGEYFVICGDASIVFNCNLDVSPNSNLVQNGSPDAVALFQGATLIDTVSYEGDVPGFTEGSGAGLTDSGSGGQDNRGISRIPDGLDTDSNNVDFQNVCITPGAENTSDASNCPTPGPPALRINEIDYDQPGADTAEFIELVNAGDGAADLTGVSLVLVNGNGAAPYQTIALPAVTVAAGGYYVVCADALTVANCDLAAINSIQNGAPDAVALTFEGNIVDTVSYEGDVAGFVEGSGAGLFDSGSSGQDFRGISRVPNGTDTDQNNVDFQNVCITPGNANATTATGCTANGPLAEIFEIQGNAAASPFEGQAVATVANVVTCLAPDGFFMQTPAARDDGDINTSNGIFVFTDTPPTVAVGDVVDVAGGVSEFFGFTEIDGDTVTVTGTDALPAAVVFDASVPSPDPNAPSCAIEYECYEGMLVDVANGTVGGSNQRFGPDPIAEVHITAGTRAFREPGVEFPGLMAPPIPTWDGNPEVFELDPDRLGLTNQIIPAGSTFSATGVLGFEFGGYELWPQSLMVNAAPLPTPVRAAGADERTIGSLNLFRLFDDIADGNETVVSAAEYQRRLSKLSQYIRGVLLSPDVLAVQEVESQTVLQDLADQIALDDPSVVYTAYVVEGNDVGGIDVGFLVQDDVAVDAVTQLGAAEILTFDGSLLHDRPPLLLEGRFLCAEGNGSSFKVMVVHNRSLNGIDAPSSGPRVRQKRLEQAQSIAEKVQAIQVADADARLVVVGDFNAFEFTDGYVDAVGQIAGDFTAAENLLSGPDLVDPNLTKQVNALPAGERYSFVFRGTAQTLDHALTSQGFAPFVTDLQFGRGNADAAVDLINDDSTPLRASDHDGFVLYVITDCDGDSIPDDLDICPGTSTPEGVPTKGLKPNRYALVDGDGVFDTVTPPGGGAGEVFTLEDTAGCSCEQIIDALGLGNGHTKHGCSVGAMRNWVDMVNP